ncbi:MAG: hypothetical protein V2B20_11025 [Pseudomonadota bacterium]
MFRAHTILLFCIPFIALQMFPDSANSRSENDNVRYISDLLVINVKDHLEKPYEVVATVHSDDPVRLIEEKGEYLKIETTDGKQGWIAKHFVKSDTPKALLINQLRQEISDLKNQLNSKAIVPPDAIDGEKPANVLPLCQEVQQKLNNAEKQISQLQEELTSQRHQSHEPPSSPPGLAANDHLIVTDQLEQTPENFESLMTEYEKQSKLIASLQQNIAKREDQTGFLWFGAGAAVFLIGLLTGKTSNRKKNKFMY